MECEEKFILDTYETCLSVSQEKKEFCANDVVWWIVRGWDSDCPNNNFYIDQGKIKCAIELLVDMKFLLFSEYPPHLKSSLYTGPVYYKTYNNKWILKFIEWIAHKYIWIFLRRRKLFNFIKVLLISNKATGISN